MTRKERYQSDPEYRERIKRQARERRERLRLEEPAKFEEMQARRRKGPRQYPPLPTEKACTRCKQLKPATTEFFSPRKAGRHGLNSWCKECIAKHRRQKYETDEEYRERVKALARDVGKEKWANDAEFRKHSKETAKRNKRRYRADPIKGPIVRAKDSEYERANRPTIRKRKLISENRRRARKNQLLDTVTDDQIGELLAAATVCPDCNRRYTTKRTRSLDHVTPIAAGGGHALENLREQI